MVTLLENFKAVTKVFTFLVELTKTPINDAPTSFKSIYERDTR